MKIFDLSELHELNKFFFFERKVEHLNYHFLLHSNCSDSSTSMNHLSKLVHGNLLYFNYGTVITTDKK